MTTGRRGTRAVVILVLLLLTGLAVHRVGGHVRGLAVRRAAERALERRDFQEAYRHFETGFGLSGDAEWRLAMARTARRQGNLAEALRLLRLYEQEGGWPEATLLERQLMALQSGDLREADGLARYCAEHPETAESLLILEALIQGSLRTLDLARAQGALDLWRQHRTTTADRVQGLIWSATWHQVAGDPERARAAGRQAVELDPESRLARLALVELLVRDAPDEAGPHLEVLRQRHPDDSDVLLQSALWHRTLGRPDEAAALLDRLLEIDPERIEALVERGNVALDLRQFDEAERWLAQAVRQAPDRREALLAMSRCLRLSGRTAEADRYAERARQIEDRLQRRLEALTGQAERPP